MATLIASRDAVFISNGLKLLIMDLKRNDHTIHDGGKSCSPEELKMAKENSKILITDISPCGKLLAVADDLKRLLVWETNSMTLKYETKVDRRITRIAFSPNSDKVFTADKSGDSYSYNLSTQKEELLLGHLSILTGVSLSKDGSLLITSDRDEKIRISHFPNAYNILGFCLGHESFVTNFKLLKDDHHLVSSSGDGSLRLWNYRKTTQVSAVYPLQDIHPESKTDEPLAVINLGILELEDNHFVFAILEKSSILACYKVLEADLKFHSSIELREQPIELCVSPSGLIWTLSKNDLHVLRLQGRKLEFARDHDSLIDTVKNKDSFFKDLEGPEDKLEQLRKRVMDNTAEYLKRKEERLGKEVQQQPRVKKAKS